MVFDKIKQYGQLVMFSHTIFSLSFSLMAILWSMANSHSLKLITFFWALIALISARNGANAINRVVDCEIDSKNPRTAHRHIPSGTIKKKEALILAILLFIVFEISAFMINPLCFLLSPIALFLFVIYSYTKRFTWLSHVILGITCGGAPVGAWLAVTGSLSLTPFVIGAAVTFWVAGFDIIYATQDIEFDCAQGLFSIPAKFGLQNALRISALFHCTSMILLLLLNLFIDLGLLYHIGIMLCAFLLLLEHKIINPSQKSIMNWASYHINQIISITFLIFAFMDFIIVTRI